MHNVNVSDHTIRVSSKFYRIHVGSDGMSQCIEVGMTPLSPCEGSFSLPNVIDDSMPAIKHPVTEEMIDSKSRYYKTNRNLGLEVVGDKDLLSTKKRATKDYLPESKVMEAQLKAEAILEDPSKRRAYREAQHEKMDKLRQVMRNLQWA